MNETRQTMSLSRQLLLLTAILAVIAVAAVIGLLAGDGDSGTRPVDAERCAILEDSFEIYSKLISEHDRSWSQWEAVNAEKWAAYDDWHALGCDD
jgi:hypothetical protein